jgi:hypothetical protein
VGRRTDNVANLIDKYDSILAGQGLAVIPLRGAKFGETDPIECPLGNKKCRLGGASCEGSSECPLTSSTYVD